MPTHFHQKKNFNQNLHEVQRGFCSHECDEFFCGVCGVSFSFQNTLISILSFLILKSKNYLYVMVMNTFILVLLCLFGNIGTVHCSAVIRMASTHAARNGLILSPLSQIALRRPAPINTQLETADLLSSIYLTKSETKSTRTLLRAQQEAPPLKKEPLNNPNFSFSNLISKKSRPYITELGRASASGDLDRVLELLRTHDPAENDQYALRKASENGHYGIVRILLQYTSVDASVEHSAALRYASANGHANVVELLLRYSNSDPSALFSYALRMAASNGHLQVVQLLIEDGRVDVTAKHNEAIRWACFYGHWPVVDYLLKQEGVNPRDENNFCVKWAKYNNHMDVHQGIQNYLKLHPEPPPVRRRRSFTSLDSL